MFLSITTSELEGKLDVYEILDVRDADDFSARHIEGATNIPISELEENVNTLSKEKVYAVICYAGGRSQRATEFLDSQGFQVTNVSGGMNEWSK
ncbi:MULTISPECIES: rhodanese-like domain-containing protein [Listeria]|uniref:rhodanese-like domain-containing protein n=1 Tax=Listeria TaxID=1637 RepID=UPI000B58974A|nr:MULTISPECIES: rhodanese-like domain-containing protein [Listeria]